MTPLAVAAVWAGAGLTGAAVLPAARLRRLGVLVPFAGLTALLFAVVVPHLAVPTGGAPGALQLDRTAQGLLMAAAISVALMLVMAPTIEGPELITLGLVGASAVIALTATSPVVWALALLGGVATIALRWIAVAPGRVTLAAGRVAIGGGAVLLAAAPFLPVAGVAAGARPVLVAALLACGAAALLGLLPLGGWALGGVATLRPVEASAWPLLLAPAVLLSAERMPAALPVLGAATLGSLLLGMGVATSLWHGFFALRVPEERRYARVFVADLGLAAAAIGSGHPGLAQTGGLFLVLTHLLVGPLLLQPPERWRSRPRRLAWLLLSGVPPTPAFWGRFLLLEGLGQVSVATLILVALAMGLAFLAAVLGARGSGESPSGRGIAAGPHGMAALAAGWLVVVAGAALGLLSQAGATAIFGPG